MSNIEISNNPRDYLHIGCIFWSLNYSDDVVFLLGQEHPEIGWPDQLKWSNFGGRPERQDKDVYTAAARETYEESLGFCGTYDEILSRILDKNNTIYYSGKAVLFGIEIDYNPDLPKLFGDVYEYTKQCMNVTRSGKSYIPSCKKEGLYEKVGLRWFNIEEIIENKDIMRPIFYKFFMDVIYPDFSQQ